MKILMLSVAGLLLPLLVWAGPVNVNTADAELIAKELAGIGLSKAQAIIDFRNEYGSFESAEELVKVKGIGPRVLAANAGNIIVDD